MTAGAFSRFCIYMIMAQMVFSLIAAAAELILNQLGLSMDTLTELASVGSDMGIMMMIYAGFVGPVVEELVFRGFLMRRFEKYGKGFAVIVSAVLFGVMHGNPLPDRIRNARGTYFRIYSNRIFDKMVDHPSHRE